MSIQIPKRQSTEEERKFAIDVYTQRMSNYLKQKPGGKLTNEGMMEFVNCYYLDMIKSFGNNYGNLNNKDKRLIDYLAIRMSIEHDISEKSKVSQLLLDSGLAAER